MRLQGKTALVTGGGRGIGQAIALRFAREGARVAIFGPHADTLAGTVDKARAVGGEIEPIVGDATKQEQIDRAMERFMQRYGRIDILVNNAGHSASKPFFEQTAEDWMRALELNLVGAFLCAQAAARPMLEAKSGKIINITSVRGVGHAGREGVMGYSAAKAGMASFTMTLAKQLAPHVTVNAVAPGHTKTDIWKALPDQVKAGMLEGTYLKRFAEPEDIAHAVLFLASPEADFITGQQLVVDGGFSLK